MLQGMVLSISQYVSDGKLLQAHVDGALLGQSATQMFTYEVFLWRTPMVLTTNNWDLSSLAADELEWVAANCVAVRVDTPVFAPARTAPAFPKPVPQPRPTNKRQRATSG